MRGRGNCILRIGTPNQIVICCYSKNKIATMPLCSEVGGRKRLPSREERLCFSFLPPQRQIRGCRKLRGSVSPRRARCTPASPPACWEGSLPPPRPPQATHPGGHAFQEPAVPSTRAVGRGRGDVACTTSLKDRPFLQLAVCAWRSSCAGRELASSVGL